MIVTGCYTTAKYNEQTSKHQEEDTINNKDEKNVSAVDKITQRILEKTDRQDQKIAVIEFSELKGSEYAESAKGKLVSERLITNLVNSGRVTVIERSQLEKVIDELKLNLQGIIDSSSAREVGTLLGIDSLVTGTVIELAENTEINARMIDAKSGKIISAITVHDLIDLPDKIAVNKDDTLQHQLGPGKKNSRPPMNNHPPENKAGLEERYKRLFSDKKFLRLIKETKHLIEQNPDNLIARYYLGLSLVRIKRPNAYANAVEHLRFVIKNGRGHRRMRKSAAKNLVFALFKSGRKKEADLAMNRLIRHFPELRRTGGVTGILKESDI